MTVTRPTHQIVLDEPVRLAAKAFAVALAESPEFQAFEDSAVAFKQDRAAQEAVRLFQEKQSSLQMMQKLGVLEQAELDELKRLRDGMMNQPCVHAYVDAQNVLILLCQAMAKQLNETIGLDFAGACAPKCCG